MATTLVQVAYRVRTDATAASGGIPVWGAAQSTTFFPGLDKPFRIRILCQNTGSTTATAIQVLRYKLNAGAYTAITTGTAPVKAIDATAGLSADNSSIATGSFVLTGGTGTAQAGQYDDTGATASYACTTGRFWEFEFGLQINSAGVNHGDTLSFEVYNSTSAYSTYTQVLTITVQKAATGTLSVTEAGDVLSAVGSSNVGGSLTLTEASEILTSTAGPVGASSLSITETADVLASVGTVADPSVTGTLAITEGDDAINTTAGPISKGALTVIEAAEALVSVGGPVNKGLLTVTEAAEILASAGSPIAGASLVRTEDSDALTSVGKSIISGALTLTEVDEVLSSALSVLIFGSFGIIEDVDSLSSSGTVAVAADTGNLTITESDYAISAIASLIVSGTINVVDADILFIAASLNEMEFSDILYATAGASVSGWADCSHYDTLSAATGNLPHDSGPAMPASAYRKFSKGGPRIPWNRAGR